MKPILLLFTSFFVAITLQAQVSKTIEVSAGGLEKVLTEEELITITNLTLTGTIDARDFMTMNYMPSLSELDLSGVDILDYQVPNWSFYERNTIPSFAFTILQSDTSNINLKSVKLPLSCTTIKHDAFNGCSGLTSVIIPSSVTYIRDRAFKDCIALTSVVIPPSVRYIGYWAFKDCSGLTSIFVNVRYLFDCFRSNPEVFDGVDKSKCTLYVPDKFYYAGASQWRDFSNIVEIPFVELSTSTVSFRATQDNPVTINIISDSNWTVSSNQSWLTVNKSFGTGDQTLTINAEVNTLPTKRTALVAFKINDSITNTLIINQIGTSKLINVTAGGLNSLLSDKEIKSVTSITLTGTIDKRDFEIMRCMPLLAEIDMKEVDIVNFIDEWGLIYPANTIPATAFGFWGASYLDYVLKYFKLPLTCNSIEGAAFTHCAGLSSITIPSSVNSIGLEIFFMCSGLTSIFAHSSTPVDLTSRPNVFYDLDKSNCTLFVPYGSKLLYADADQWKDFTNIEEIPFIEVFKTQLNIAASQGSTTTTKIVSDVGWTASSDQTWLTLSQSTGTGEDTLSFTADGNPGTSPRTATVTVSAEGVESQTITITQKAWPTNVEDLAGNSTQIKCYPNPFTREISMEIQNPKRNEISVDIYNLAGERIKSLAIKRTDEKVDLTWNGTNDSGQRVVSGVYICTMNKQSKQLILLK